MDSQIDLGRADRVGIEWSFEMELAGIISSRVSTNPTRIPRNGKEKRDKDRLARYSTLKLKLDCFLPVMGILSVVATISLFLFSLSRSCVVTVEPLSRQQVGLLGTQRGWPPGSTDTTITVITTTSARDREQRRHGNTVNRSASLPASSSFFLSNLPRPAAPPPRLTSPIITNNY